MQTRIDASYSGIHSLIRIKSRKSLRDGECRRVPINKQGFVEEGQIVSQLQRSRGADFLATIEKTVSTPNYGVSICGRSPGQSDARREIGFVTFYQRVGSSVRTRSDQCPSGIIEIALPVVGFDQRGKVVVT